MSDGDEPPLALDKHNNRERLIMQRVYFERLDTASVTMTERELTDRHPDEDVTSPTSVG